MAGMNDHLCKPIDPDRLFAVLMTYIQPRVRDQTQIEPECAPGEQTDLEEVPGIDMLSAVRRVMGNRALLEKLLNDFHRDHATTLVDVERYFAQGQWEQARQMLHRIKGVAGNLGAYKVHETAEALELAVRQGQKGEWPMRIEAFVQAVRVVLSAIADRASRTIQPIENARALEILDLAESERETLQETLVKLADALDACNAQAESILNAAKPLLLRAGFPQEVAQMTELLDTFQFREAHAILPSIAEKLGFSS